MKREVDRRRVLSRVAESRRRAVRIPRGRLGHGAARLRSRRGRAELEDFGTRLGFPDMFERVFGVHEYTPGVAFFAAEHEVVATRVPHYRLEAHALRVADGAKTIAYSGDSGPSAALVECARDADLFVCEATLLRGALDGEPRGHLALDEALEAFEAAGAKRLLVTHRPAELPSDGGLEFAYDGLELAV